MWLKLVVFIVLTLFAAETAAAQTRKPAVKPKAKNPSKPVASDNQIARAREILKQGKADWAEGATRRAIDRYTEAIRLDPQYIDAYRARADAYFTVNDFAGALPDIDRVLKAEPDNPKFLNYRGVILTESAIKTKENDKNAAAEIAQRALADFSRAIGIEPANHLNFLGRGKLLLEFEFYAEAISDLEKSISLRRTEKGYAYLGLARYHSNAGNGIDDVNTALQIYSSYAEGFYIRGLINLGEKRVREALEDFDRALKLEKSVKYYNARGLLYFRLGDGYLAVADFTNAIAADPSNATAYFNRAYTYKKFPDSVSTDSDVTVIDKIRLQRKKMLEDLDLAIKHGPSFDEAYVERGLVFATSPKIGLDAARIAELNRAIADFSQAIQINPGNVQAYGGRGRCNAQLGKNNLALADFDKAIGLDPDFAEAYIGRMGVFCNLGKNDLAAADERKIKSLGATAFNPCGIR